MQLAVTQIFFRYGDSLNKVSIWGSDLLHLDSLVIHEFINDYTNLTIVADPGFYWGTGGALGCRKLPREA